MTEPYNTFEVPCVKEVVAGERSKKKKKNEEKKIKQKVVNVWKKDWEMRVIIKRRYNCIFAICNHTKFAAIATLPPQPFFLKLYII